MKNDSMLYLACQYSEIDKIQALWRSVVNEAINDLITPVISPEIYNSRKEIIEWIHSHDFYKVCQLAGLDYSGTKKIFINLIKTIKTKKYRESVKNKRRTTPHEKRKWRKISIQISKIIG